MAASIFPPTITTNILVNTRTQPKIVYLPAASTVGAGKLYFIKDICGNAGVSSIYVSTTGLDSFDYKFRPSTINALMSTNFQSILLAADGLTNWMVLQNYTSNLVLRPFSPTNISGLAFWYDASDTSTMTFSGSVVTQWRDKSGNSRNANQNTGATFSVNSLVFTGSQTYNAANSSNLLRNVYFAVFFVERLNTTGTSFLFGDITSGITGGSLHVGYRSSTNATMAFWNADLEITTITGTGATRIWSFILPSTGFRYANLNGSLIGTYTTNTQLNAFNTLQIGGAFNGNFYNGSMYEIVGYNVNLSTLQIQQNEGYLAWKWGLQGNLPANHPYKNSPP